MQMMVVLLGSHFISVIQQSKHVLCKIKLALSFINLLLHNANLHNKLARLALSVDNVLIFFPIQKKSMVVSVHINKYCEIGSSAV